MDKLFDENISKQIAEFFGDLSGEVALLFFGREGVGSSEANAVVIRMAEEIAALSGLVTMEVYDIDKDVEKAKAFNVDSAPALVIAGKENGQLVDYGVRYLGVPSGHELTSLANSILIVSQRDSGLSLPSRNYLKEIKQLVNLKVFVTPTCPYCPRAVILAHQFAMESPLVQAEMVNAYDYPDLANHFNVSGVPQTTINSGAATVVGAAPEAQLMAHIQQALAA